jgi:V/A-type H+-transporting ATPase subunit C
MAQGGVSGYAATNSRVRVMYSTLLAPQEWASLAEAADYPAIIEQLKRTAYGPYLDKVNDRDLTPRRAVFQIKGRLADAYMNIINTVPGQARPVIAQLYRNFEVDNLKAVLRGVVTRASWDRVRYVLFPLGSFTVLPAKAMVETGNVGAAVELLRGTQYYEPLSFAMKRYSAEQNLFPLEVALDLFYWRKLWAEVSRLSNQDRTQAIRIVGSLLDTNNLMWAIRYRVYHRLSEEELINYTLPIGYRVHDIDIRSLAAGADIAMTVSRIFPDIPNVDAMLREPRTGLPQLERELQRYVANQCRAAFTGNPFHVGIPLAYLVLHDFEIQDLTVLIEAKSVKVPAEEFRPLLVMGDTTLEPAGSWNK